SANRLIVIGETRGAEAQVLAQALNMGMGALTTFHGGSSEEVITRLMSPPINMSKHQIGSIWTIVIMGIGCVNSKGVGRCVERVDEILMDDDIDIHTVYSVEENSPGIMERSIRLRRASRTRNSGNILVKTG
ncbi:MAG: ATPase, T2SS/T4P/T4SS family, partial [Sulfolobales archaeon]